ncbi:hypothetical protein X975_08603, partial [Stegodyphus mimosarum]
MILNFHHSTTNNSSSHGWRQPDPNLPLALDLTHFQGSLIYSTACQKSIRIP